MSFAHAGPFFVRGFITSRNSSISDVDFALVALSLFHIDTFFDDDESRNGQPVRTECRRILCSLRSLPIRACFVTDSHSVEIPMQGELVQVVLLHPKMHIKAALSRLEVGILTGQPAFGCCMSCYPDF